jgi:hypothetical protein
MNPTAPVRRSKPSEEGYILVAVMFMLAALVIALSVAEPRIAASIQRDRELETMRRGKQYARAVKLYYKQFNSYPPNVDALVQTNNIRYLRKKYLDPTTGKADWRPIPYGQQKTQTLGFFGQPIGGAPGAGLTNSLTPNTLGSSGGTPTGGPAGSGLFNSSDSSSSSQTGSNPTSVSPAAPTTGAIDPNTGQPITGTGGSPGTGTGTGTGTTGTTGNDTNGISAIGTPGANGQAMGVGIMGFSPASPKQSILVYKKKNHYNEWEFLYDPIAEQMMQMGGGATGTGLTPSGTTNGGPGGTTNNGSSFGNSTTFGGSSTPGSTFGGSSTFGGGAGSGSSTPSQPNQPQQ